MSSVVKSDDECRFTLSVVYSPNTMPRRGQDGRIDLAPEKVLRDAAWAYMRKGAKVGLSHKAGTEGAGVVVESYIWPAGDWVAPNGYVVKAGDWLLGVIWEPSIWAAIKAGKYNGLSFQGSARRRRANPKRLRKLQEV